MTRIKPVILCGGSGTRLWPKSRKGRPKPFIPLIGGTSLFAQTMQRFTDEAVFSEPLIVAGQAHVALIEEQIEPGHSCSILVEPAARNTAPAIALAAARLDPETIMMVCPSDHHIADSAAFQSAAQAAARLAGEGWLTAFGIIPDRAETGYGYIRQGRAVEGGHRVAQFVEKPDLVTAERFLGEGGYSWNGGIFAFRAGQLLDELRKFRPAMADAAVASVAAGRDEGARFYPDASSFADIAGESIDYAVMENTDRAAVVPASMGWSDVGDWAAVQRLLGGDAAGNRAQDQHQLMDCRNVMVLSEGAKVSAIDLEDICIIIDGDDVLIMPLSSAQRVGKLDGASNQ